MWPCTQFYTPKGLILSDIWARRFRPATARYPAHFSQKTITKATHRVWKRSLLTVRDHGDRETYLLLYINDFIWRFESRLDKRVPAGGLIKIWYFKVKLHSTIQGNYKVPEIAILFEGFSHTYSSWWNLCNIFKWQSFCLINIMSNHTLTHAFCDLGS